MKLKIYTDGASRNNPGDAGIGVVIKKDNKVVKEIGDYVGKTTNNIAEYMALIRGLEEALVLKAAEVECFADSELLVRQINGEYKVKNEGLIPLFYIALSLIKKFKSFEIHHLPRANNARADELANHGLDLQTLKNSPLFDKL
jgi:ribonuclease HI